MKRIGFLCEGASEIVLIRSRMFQEILNELGLTSVGAFDIGGRDNLVNENQIVNKKINILTNLGAERIFVLSDLEFDPCISSYKKKIYNYSNLIIHIVSVRAIESWLLSDSTTLSNLLKKRYYFEYPESTPGLPLNELQKIFIKETGRGLGIGYRKPKIMKKFIHNGFSLKEASNHPNCSSVKYFLNRLKKLSTGN